MKKLTFAVGLLLALTALGAQAHARLKASNPKEGAVVTEMQMSAAVSLTFSETARITAVSLQKDQEPKQKLTAPATTGEQIDVTVPKLPPGAYTLSWRVASTDDNHIMSGELHFRVTAGRLNKTMEH